MKICIHCKLEKDEENFYTNKTFKDNLSSCCKNCTKIKVYKWKKNNIIKTKKSQKKYYNKVKDTTEFKERMRKSKFIYNNSKIGKFHEIQFGAKRREMEFNLTFDEFSLYWNQPCYYCSGEIKTVGIDRIDNNIGYELYNCVPCCITCNIMKRSLNLEDFLEKCKKIILNN